MKIEYRSGTGLFLVPLLISLVANCFSNFTAARTKAWSARLTRFARRRPRHYRHPAQDQHAGTFFPRIAYISKSSPNREPEVHPNDLLPHGCDRMQAVYFRLPLAIDGLENVLGDDKKPANSLQKNFHSR